MNATAGADLVVVVVGDSSGSCGKFSWVMSTNNAMVYNCACLPICSVFALPLVLAPTTSRVAQTIPKLFTNYSQTAVLQLHLWLNVN